jgi:hypothetical protein
MRKRDSNNLIVLGAIMASAVSLYWIFTTMAFPGIPATLGATFGTILPGLLVAGLAMITAISMRSGPAAMGAYTVTGLGLALLVFELNAAGVLTNAMLLPATVAQVQVLIIVVGFVVGIIAYRS